MPVQPKPFKYKCPKCGYSKVVKPKSDAMNPLDLMDTCPKCGAKMKRQGLNLIDTILDKFH